MEKKLLTYKDDQIVRTENALIPKDVYRTILDNIPLLCVDLVIVKDNKVFLIKRRNKPCEGFYWIQGGRMIKNEEIEQCGIRKAALELNIPQDKIKITKCLGTFSTEFNDSEHGVASHTVNITFQASIDEVPRFDHDHSDGRWFDMNGSIPAELGRYKHHPYIAEIFKLIAPIHA